MGQVSEVEEDGRADEIGEDVKGLECLPLRSGVSGWVMKEKEIKKRLAGSVAWTNSLTTPPTKNERKRVKIKGACRMYHTLLPGPL